MKQQQFDALISKLEQEAELAPRAYMVKVLLVAALGFLVLGVALLFALLPLAALLGLVFLVIITGGKALIVLLKLGKLIILLLIPAWVMLKSSVQMLFARFPKPQGRELKPAEAPALFKRIDELRARMRGPAIHHVLLTQEMNAAIVQHPRFGLLGWEENYLILGLPLLQVMSEAEALAVVAHEYGHLSGHHSRLGGFIYRMRTAWGRLQNLSEQWNDWGSRLITKLFSRYAPYFNAYTFVFARRNEYIADSVSVELVGAEATANALMRSKVASHFEHEVFWPDIDQLASSQAEPIKNRSQYWNEAVLNKLDEEKRIRYLDLAKQRQTDHFDTHPSLSDRLKAIGVVPDAEHAKQLVPLTQTAAQVWLGEQYPTITQEFDHAWRQQIAEQWQQRHQYLLDQHEQLIALQAKPELTMDERWQVILLEEELLPEINLLDRIQAFVADFPEHPHARYRRGVALLNQENEQGIADLEFVMSKEEDAILSACEVAMRFYHDKQPEKAEEYRQRWIKRNDYLLAVQKEFESMPADATLVEHNLDKEALSQVKALVTRDVKYIRKIYLLRRQLKADANLYDYVLAFEPSRWTLGDKSTTVLNRLSAVELTFAAFIVNLKSPTYKHFNKAIAQLKVPPLYEK